MKLKRLLMLSGAVGFSLALSPLLTTALLAQEEEASKNEVCASCEQEKGGEKSEATASVEGAANEDEGEQGVVLEADTGTIRVEGIAHASSDKENSKATYLRNPSPSYPSSLKRAGVHGAVQLRIQVDARGGVSSVEMLRSSGSPILDENTIKTVRSRWTFKQAIRDGVPVPSQVIVPFNFA